MNNKELGEFIESENFKKSSDSLIAKTEDIIGAGADLVTSAFFGLPSYSLLKPFIDGLRDWKSRVELKQLAYFLREFENLNQSERSDFSLMIQTNEEDFTERLFYYVSQLNDKRKAEICGKMAVSLARMKIKVSLFFTLVQKIKDTPLEELMILKKIIEGNDVLRMVNSDPEYEKFFFLSIVSLYSISDHEKHSLLANGFLFEKYNWRNLGRTSDMEKLEDVVNVIRDQKPQYSFTESAYFIYKFGLKI